MALAVCAGLVIASFVFDIDKLGIYLFGFKWPMTCFLHRVFGIKCALCGMSRSFVSMAHGNFANAFEFHHLGPVVFAYVVLQIPYRIWAIVRFPGKTRVLTRIMAAGGILLLLAIFINWFCYLAERFLWTH